MTFLWAQQIQCPFSIYCKKSENEHRIDLPIEGCKQKNGLCASPLRQTAEKTTQASDNAPFTLFTDFSAVHSPSI
jgi:hypothetical protein